MSKRTATVRPGLIMRAVLAVAAGCVALAVAAAPSASAVTIAQHTRSTPAAQSPREVAEADAASMLAAFQPPPGAQRSGAIALSALSAAPAGSPGSDFVTRTSWWLVPGTMDTVLDWVKAHPPAGFTLGGSGYTSDASTVTSRFDVFSLPPVADVLTERSLYVSVASDGADGTALRVDSQVAWLPTKPSDERIPATAKIVTITALPGIDMKTGKPASSPGQPVTVTDPVTVTKIAGLVDALPLMPPGVFACPFSTGQGLRLRFRAVEGGPVLAEVTGYTNGCGTVMLVVGGERMPTLWGGAELAKRVLKLAGIDWDGF